MKMRLWFVQYLSPLTAMSCLDLGFIEEKDKERKLFVLFLLQVTEQNFWIFLKSLSIFSVQPNKKKVLFNFFLWLFLTFQEQILETNKGFWTK